MDPGPLGTSLMSNMYVKKGLKGLQKNIVGIAFCNHRLEVSSVTLSDLSCKVGKLKKTVMRSVPEDNVTLYSSPVLPSLTLVLLPEHVGIIGPSGEIFKKNYMKAVNRQKQPPCIRCLDQKREKVEAFTKTFCSIHRGYGKKHCANKKR